MRAKAIVFEGVRRAVFRDVDVPEPAPGEVVVRTRWSLISNGTEGSFLRGERVEGDTPARAGDALPFPQVTGYQKVGRVERPAREGPGAALREGQWVHVTISRVGLPGRPFGGHVAMAVAPAEQVYALPEGLDPVEASGLVLTQVGYNCGMKPPSRVGDVAVVIGDGMVGHWAAQTLRHLGVRVVLLGRHEYRYKRYRPAPGDGVIDVSKVTSVADAVRAAAPEGLNVIVDTVGTNTMIAELFDQLRHGRASVVSAGFLGTAGAIDIQMLRNREATLYCPSGWERGRMERTLGLLAEGLLEVSPLITHRLAVSEGPRAFDMILAKQDGLMGVLLDWSDA